MESFLPSQDAKRTRASGSAKAWESSSSILGCTRCYIAPVRSASSDAAQRDFHQPFALKRGSLKMTGLYHKWYRSSDFI